MKPSKNLHGGGKMGFIDIKEEKKQLNKLISLEEVFKRYPSIRTRARKLAFSVTMKNKIQTSVIEPLERISGIPEEYLQLDRLQKKVEELITITTIKTTMKEVVLKGDISFEDAIKKSKLKTKDMRDVLETLIEEGKRQSPENDALLLAKAYQEYLTM